MRRIASIVGAMLLVAGTAWAADMEGKIKSVDAGERSIVLEDGTKLWAAEGLGMEKLQEGAKVKLSYEERDGKSIVTAYEVQE